MAILDSTGASIWLNDNVSAPDGNGVVTALLEDPLQALELNVVVTINGVQFSYASTQVTITSRASEQSLTADQVAASEVN